MTAHKKTRGGYFQPRIFYWGSKIFSMNLWVSGLEKDPPLFSLHYQNKINCCFYIIYATHILYYTAHEHSMKLKILIDEKSRLQRSLILKFDKCPSKVADQSLSGIFKLSEKLGPRLPFLMRDSRLLTFLRHMAFSHF